MYYIDHFPTQHEPVDAGFGRPEKLFTLPDQPEVVIRLDTESVSEPMSAIMKQAKTFRALLDEIATDHDIDVVPHQMFVAQRRGIYLGSPGLYIAAQRVHGVALVNEATELPNPSVPADPYVRATGALAAYYAAKSRQHGNVILDLDPRQIMYGTLAGQDTPQNYLTDLDINFAEFNPDRPAKTVLEKLHGRMYALAYCALKGQERHGNRFGAIRDQLDEAYGQLVPLQEHEWQLYPATLPGNMRKVLGAIT